MLTFRPDVTIYPLQEFFPVDGNVMATEDFWWAMHHAVEPLHGGVGAALELASRVAILAKSKLNELPLFPEAALVHMPTGNAADSFPIPLLIARTASGTPILGVYSDIHPHSTT